MDLIDFIILLLLIPILTTFYFRRRSNLPSTSDNLPPGPPGWPLVGNLFQVALQRRPFMYIVRDLRSKYGPIFTMRMGQRTLIIVTSSDLIHQALIHHGPLFASRPPDSPTRLLFSSHKCTINSSEYGPLWRSLRRNFVSEIVSPSRVRSFSWIRDWAISNHLSRLRNQQLNHGFIHIMPNCRLTICSILVCICFGAKVPETLVADIESVLKDVMMMTTLKLPDFLPSLSPLFRHHLNKAKNLRNRQMNCLLPLVRARRAFVNGSTSSTEFEMVSGVGDAYIDSLFSLEPPGRGKLGEEELVTLCSEVMSAGTDTSATALEWAMAHLVLDQDAQEKVYKEVVKEKEVESMGYLLAVVKETLRRHPPSHFVLSHAATRETELGGYRVPAGVNVEFYTAWVTEDPAVWTEPGEWRPERFLEGGEGWEVDVTGKRGVHMMPFGVGRRICPAASLGMLHVQLMLARMVREFRWLPVNGEKPDLTETFAFTVVMKDPLRAVVVERG
ncbi:hypothetical protein J5N97_016688 [Dioscorea zingiberensis]|uniref:Cytochrome P450 n=1 Tax=Dioscorea zingiberensis TaxID=325984 RepID=A0A9D5CLK4_9LILI|nr:hypothetical protein J5N97_016688 [Dioscorea zingiberensis]